MRRLILLFIFSVTFINLFATPPLPPYGKRWVYNPEYSDEFNGTKLDDSKWYDYHPTWKGRPPGLFMPSQINVSDGFMRIRGEKMGKDTIVNGNTYNIKCGAVISKKQTAWLGYYECRFKAGKSTLSTTFWFSNRKNFDGPETCNDKYSQEWDVQECIGRTGDFNGSWFASGMHSNAHYWYTDCEGERHDYRANDVRFDSPELASDNFNVYGGWWKDENNATYYFNNGDSKDQQFYDQVSDKPFANPMGMNLVCETYPFPWIELPTDEELADPEKNVCYYDWVRAYKLLDVNEPITIEETTIISNGDFETGSLNGWGGWGSPGADIVSTSEHVYAGNYAVHILGAGAPEQTIALEANTSYKLTCFAKATSGNISLGVKSNSSGQTISSTEIADSEYKEYSISFNSGDYSDLKIYFYAQAGEEGYADNFEIVEEDPGSEPEPEVPIALFEENVNLDKTITSLPTSKLLNIPYTYMANEERNVHFELRNSDDQLIKDTTLMVYAGYGNTSIDFSFPSAPEAKSGYKLVANLLPLESKGNDQIMTDMHTISLTFPTSINTIEQENKEKSMIYPNPANSYLHVSGFDEGIRYQVYNILGKQVLDGVLIGNKIQVSSLVVGTYILRLNGSRFLFMKGM